MKAIKLGEGNYVIGVPETWNSQIGYQYSSEQRLYADGWRDIITPTFNTTTQFLTNQLEDVVENSEIVNFRYIVGNYTVEQIAENTQNALDNDIAAAKVNQRIADGELFYKRTMDKIERAFYENLLSVEPIKFANRYFDVALSPLERGNWASAQTALLTTPTIPVSYTAAEKTLLSNFYTEIKNEVSAYVAQTYQRILNKK